MGTYLHFLTAKTKKVKFQDKKVVVAEAPFYCKPTYREGSDGYKKMMKRAEVARKLVDRGFSPDMVCFSPIQEGAVVYEFNGFSNWMDTPEYSGNPKRIGTITMEGKRFVIKEIN